MNIPELCEWINVGVQSGDSHLIIYRNLVTNTYFPIFVCAGESIENVRRVHEVTIQPIFVKTISLVPRKREREKFQQHTSSLTKQQRNGFL